MQCVEPLLLGQCQEGVQGALPLDALAGQGALLDLVSGDGLQQSRSPCGHKPEQVDIDHTNHKVSPWEHPQPTPGARHKAGASSCDQVWGGLV